MDEFPHYATGSNVLPLANPRISSDTPAPPATLMSVPIDEHMMIELSTAEEPMQISTSSGSVGQELAPTPMWVNVSTSQPQLTPPNYPIDPSRLLLLLPKGSASATQLQGLPRAFRKALGIRLDPQELAQASAETRRLRKQEVREERRKRVEAKQMDSLLKGLDKSLRIDDIGPALSATKLHNMGRTRARKMRARIAAAGTATAAAAATTAVATTAVTTTAATTTAAVIAGQEMMGGVAGHKEMHRGGLGKGKGRGMPISHKVARQLRRCVEVGRAAGAVVVAPEISMEEGKMLSRAQAQKLRKRIRIAVERATGRLVKVNGAGEGEAAEVNVVAKVDRAGKDGAGEVKVVVGAEDEAREGEGDMMDVV